MSELDTAIENMRNAYSQRTDAIQKQQYLEYKNGGERPQFPGYMSPEWTEYVTTLNAVAIHTATYENLAHLIASQPVAFPHYGRVLGFIHEGDLYISGDWVADMDSNGQEYCITCAMSLVLSGELDIESLHSCYSDMQDGEYSVACGVCEEILFHGADELEEV